MKKKISLIYKILILIACTISIYLNFEAFTVQGAVIYYTVQSNIICFLFYLVTIILYFTKKLKKNNLYYIFKGFVTMAITITMFVYQFILSSNSTAYLGYELTCTFSHLIVPIMIILDYLIFGEKGKLKYKYTIVWSISLIIYILFDIIYILFGGRFNDGALSPYHFLDVNDLGFPIVMFNCILIYVVFILFGILACKFDNIISKKNSRVEV